MPSPTPSPTTSSPPSLKEPVDLFEQDNILSDKLNDFNTRYSRFIRCQDVSASQTMYPACNKFDTFINVQKSYQSLLSTIHDISNTLVSQELLGTTTEESAENQDDILSTYAAIREQRLQMDNILARLYSEQKAGPASSEKQVKQAMYANTLWVILASCLIWYAIVEMK